MGFSLKTACPDKRDEVLTVLKSPLKSAMSARRLNWRQPIFRVDLNRQFKEQTLTCGSSICPCWFRVHVKEANGHMSACFPNQRFWPVSEQWLERLLLFYFISWFFSWPLTLTHFGKNAATVKFNAEFVFMLLPCILCCVISESN